MNSKLNGDNLRYLSYHCVLCLYKGIIVFMQGAFPHDPKAPMRGSIKFVYIPQFIRLSIWGKWLFDNQQKEKLEKYVYATCKAAISK